MRSPDEDFLRRGMRALGSRVPADDPWGPIVRRRRQLAARRRRRAFATAAILVVAMIGAGTLLVNAFLRGGNLGPSSGVRTIDPPPSLEEQLDAQPGTILDEGELGDVPWTLYLFPDEHALVGGEGPDIYVRFGDAVRFLDRPAPGRPLDTVTILSPDRRKVLVVVVATDEVETVELVHGDRRDRARSVEPEGAAFARAFWATGAAARAPFSGTIVASDASGEPVFSGPIRAE